MKRVVLLTGDELRHRFFRLHFAKSAAYQVVATYCEGTELSLRAVVERDDADARHRLRHLLAREQCEADMFAAYVEEVGDRSRPRFLHKGDINLPEVGREIIELRPDLLVAYGCSILKGELLETFENRFVNVHLGLSPYYRGSGTNFWPLVNGEPECVGVTFMHIDTGVDTGTVIHQVRARFAPGDTPSQIGNRLIRDACEVCRSLVERFDRLEPMAQLPVPPDARCYRKKDYSEESVLELYRRFDAGLVDDYLRDAAERRRRRPIVENPTLGGGPG